MVSLNVSSIEIVSMVSRDLVAHSIMLQVKCHRVSVTYESQAILNCTKILDMFKKQPSLFQLIKIYGRECSTLPPLTSVVIVPILILADPFVQVAADSTAHRSDLQRPQTHTGSQPGLRLRSSGKPPPFQLKMVEWEKLWWRFCGYRGCFVFVKSRIQILAKSSLLENLPFEYAWMWRKCSLSGNTKMKCNPSLSSLGILMPINAFIISFYILQLFVRESVSFSSLCLQHSKNPQLRKCSEDFFNENFETFIQSLQASPSKVNVHLCGRSLSWQIITRLLLQMDNSVT